MRWRPRHHHQGEAEAWPAPYDYDPYRDDRSPELAEVLARLEAATRLRDPEAVARLLDRLSQSEDGMWLLHQCAAAGLREVAAQISTTPAQHQQSTGPAGPPIPGVRSIGAA